MGNPAYLLKTFSFHFSFGYLQFFQAFLRTYIFFLWNSISILLEIFAIQKMLDFLIYFAKFPQFAGNHMLTHFFCIQMNLEIQKLTNIIWACIKYFENYKSNSTGTTKSLSLPIKPGQEGWGSKRLRIITEMLLSQETDCSNTISPLNMVQPLIGYLNIYLVCSVNCFVLLGVSKEVSHP